MNTANDPLKGFTETTEQENSETTVIGSLKEEKFYPTGAIAFFISLVILCLVIWFGIYFIMLDRV